MTDLQELFKNININFEFRRCIKNNDAFDEILWALYLDERYLGLKLDYVKKNLNDLGYDVNLTDIYLIFVNSVSKLIDTLDKNSGDTRFILRSIKNQFDLRTTEFFQQKYIVKGHPTTKNNYVIFRRKNGKEVKNYADK